MKEKQLMKGAAFMLLAATAIPPAHAQLKTNAGVQYLLSQSKDMSQDFLDLSNTYFFADSLVSFDTSTGKGTVPVETPATDAPARHSMQTPTCTSPSSRWTSRRRPTTTIHN